MLARRDSGLRTRGLHALGGLRSERRRGGCSPRGLDGGCSRDLGQQARGGDHVAHKEDPPPRRTLGRSRQVVPGWSNAPVRPFISRRRLQMSLLLQSCMEAFSNSSSLAIACLSRSLFIPASAARRKPSATGSSCAASCASARSASTGAAGSRRLPGQRQRAQRPSVGGGFPRCREDRSRDRHTRRSVHSHWGSDRDGQGERATRCRLPLARPQARQRLGAGDRRWTGADIHNVLNPQKLAHLGEVADAWETVRQPSRPSDRRVVMVNRPGITRRPSGLSANPFRGSSTGCC